MQSRKKQGISSTFCAYRSKQSLQVKLVQDIGGDI